MNKSAITNQILSLALETTGRIGSVAIGYGEKLSDEKTFSAPLRHNAELFDCIMELLKKAGCKANQIKNVYISIGPGSFTGIRISVTVAKMLALTAGTKIVAVNTSDAMASNVDDDNIKKIGTIIDAKRGQFFISVFECRGRPVCLPNNTNVLPYWQKIMPDSMLTTQEFKEKFGNEKISLLGEGLLYYAKKFETENIKILDEKFWSPKASNVFRIGTQLAAEGKFSDPVSLVPFYIRRPEAEENWEK